MMWEFLFWGTIPLITRTILFEVDKAEQKEERSTTSLFHKLPQHLSKVSFSPEGTRTYN